MRIRFLPVNPFEHLSVFLGFFILPSYCLPLLFDGIDGQRAFSKRSSRFETHIHCEGYGKNLRTCASARTVGSSPIASTEDLRTRASARTSGSSPVAPYLVELADSCFRKACGLVLPRRPGQVVFCGLVVHVFVVLVFSPPSIWTRVSRILAIYTFPFLYRDVGTRVFASRPVILSFSSRSTLRAQLSASFPTHPLIATSSIP